MADLTKIDELRDEFVLCRTLGHAWDELPNAEFSTDMWRASVGAMALRCTRCGTMRFDYVGTDMRIFYRTYQYPDRYKTIPGEGTRPNLRGELIRRSMLIRTYDNGTRRKRRG